jgi:hypothetical protein
MSATGYYTRVENTTVSGSALHSALSGDNMRLLQFDAALKQPAVVNVSATPVSLSPNQWIQASIASLPISESAAGSISLGAGTAASQAAAYVSFFDIRTTSDVRVLRFLASETLTNNVSLTATGGFTNVSVSLDGAAAAATQVLFDSTATVGQQQSGASGSERIVLLTASNLTSGSQVVNFNVLSNSL